MFSRKALDKARKLAKEWRERVEEDYEKKQGFKLPQYATDSGVPLKSAYTPLDIAGAEVEMPGVYPYTRAGNPITYQYTPWMIQMLHGYGTSEETRERTEFLIKEGMAGYGGQKVALIQVDPPTTCGYDPDDPRVRGMVGLTGASISTLEDLHTLLSGYDLSKTRVAPNNRFSCLPMLAMYLVYAEGRGYRPSQLNGQSQNDAPTRFITTDIGAPTLETQHKLRMELIKYCTQNMPRWNHTNLCGYLYGEMCATPAQEMGIVLAQAVQLIQDGIRIGLDPDDFVPRFSSQVHMGMDFFEEVAKLRAWRRMWAKMMKERFNCQDPRSLQYRIHVQTGGSTLTSQQPLNNIARTTLQVLASVLGGVQSLHTASYDEAIGLPSEEAVRTAIRVNQIILHETKVPYVTDPLGGSYYIEWLTNRVEQEASKVLTDIEARGGFNKCIETGWLRQLLEREVIKWRREVDSGERVVVGLNRFTLDKKEATPPFTVDQAETERKAIDKVRRWKSQRDNSAAQAALQKVRGTVQSYQSLEQTGILMPALIEAARAKCTIGEMMEAIVAVSGGRVYST